MTTKMKRKKFFLLFPSSKPHQIQLPTHMTCIAQRHSCKDQAIKLKATYSNRNIMHYYLIQTQYNTTGNDI